MSLSLSNEIPSDPQLSYKDEWILRARSLLAKELKIYFDQNLKEEDLAPELNLPSEYQGDSRTIVFGFSVGAGFAKKIFVIRFQIDDKGEPIFELKELADPSHRNLRLKGEISWAFGRSQIERVLANRRNLMN